MNWPYPKWAAASRKHFVGAALLFTLLFLLSAGRAEAGGWQSISDGSSHACGVTTSGAGFCWGVNSDGEIDVPVGKSWASISAGTYHSCGVTTSGGGLCWGRYYSGEIAVPVGKLWASITAGSERSCGVTTSGAGYCWGYNSDGQIDVPTPVKPSLDAGPPSLTSLSVASFSFHGNSGATFRCSVDGAAFIPCRSPRRIVGLKDGRHSFALTQTVPDGRTSLPVETTWIVYRRLVSPILIKQRPPRVTQGLTARVSFTARNYRAFKCSLDRLPFVPCNSPVAFRVRSQGSHQLVVRHSDPAGHVASSTVSWIIDRSAPSIGRVYSYLTTKSSTVLVISANPDLTDVMRVEYSTSGGKPAASPRSASGRVLSYHSPLTIRTPAKVNWVRVQDGARNWSRWYKVR